MLKKKRILAKSMLIDVTFLKIFVYIDLSFNMYICYRRIKVQVEMNFLLFLIPCFQYLLQSYISQCTNMFIASINAYHIHMYIIL